MDYLLERFDAYEIMNNLVPGAALLLIISWETGWKLEGYSTFFEVAACYLAGLLAGRLGSLVVEPFCKATGIINMAEYEDFLEARKSDRMIDTLSAVANMYRSLASVALISAVLWGQRIICLDGRPRLNMELDGVMLWALVVVFLFSYRKQVSYVHRRVEAIFESKEKTTGSPC